jgi:hypothetical protein
VAEKIISEICALLGCYAASSGNPLPMFWDDVSVSSSRVKKSNKRKREMTFFFLDFLTLEDGADTLPRNVVHGLQLDSA